MLESEWDFRQARLDGDDDLVGIGADLKVATLITAYSQGVFPMGLGEGGSPPLGWWSPVLRGVLQRDDLRVSKSLRKSCRKFDVTVDRDFPAVIEACADPSRDGCWITQGIQKAYTELHEHGVAHSLEVWDQGDLVGGLYGVSLGGLFAGESMFHRVRDASKVALVALDRVVFDSPEPRLIDVQWATSHLSSLGVRELPRPMYLSVLEDLVTSTPINWQKQIWR